MFAPAADVAQVFDTFPQPHADLLLRIRTLIFEVAAQADIELVETLKWSEPAYLPKKARVGTTVRLGIKPKMPQYIGLFVNCQTSLIETFRTLFAELTFEGNRGVLLSVDEPLPEDALRMMIEAALTYHVSKRRAVSV